MDTGRNRDGLGRLHGVPVALDGWRIELDGDRSTAYEADYEYVASLEG